MRRVLIEAVRRVFPYQYLGLLIRRGRGIEREMALLPALANQNKISIDIGANVGFYTRQLLPLSQRVHAFEPNPDLYQQLVRTFGGRAEVHSVALSDRDDNVWLCVPEENPALGYLTESPVSADECHPIQTRTLDSFEFKNLGFIKIDVEGHEQSLLHGAAETLRREKPNVLIETEERHQQGTVRMVRDFLEDLGYAGFFYGEGELQPIDNFDPAVHQDVNCISHEFHSSRYIHNFIYLPKETCAEVAARIRKLAPAERYGANPE